MAFAVPTLATLVARIKGDINTRMGNSNALIPRSLAYALAYALAGVVWGLYRYLAYIADQVFPDTAEADSLLRWGALWIGAKNPATKASGTVIVYALAGSTLSTGAVMQRNDGERYLVTGGPYNWATTSSKDVTIQAETAGDDGNYTYATSATLTLVSPPAGVRAENPLGPIASPAALTSGADEETDESYLERIIDRIQNPPQGGSLADYEAWARATDGVSVDRVWVEGWPDVAAGYVLVYFTLTASGTGVIPAAPAVALVQAAIDPLRPVDAVAVVVAAPTPHVVTLSITVHPESGATITAAAIALELEAMFREQVEVDAGGFTIKNSDLHEALTQMTGIDWYALTAVDGGAGTADITLAGNNYPTIVAGGITLTLV